MKLHVFDFDGTIFRSPVPHPSLGESWLEWIQGATVEGFGIGWFQEPETLAALGGVAESPRKHSTEDFIHETIDMAHRAKADGDRVVVMTGRCEYFLPRIKHLLKCAEFPSDEVYAKPNLLLGTVKYKAYEIAKLVRSLNRKSRITGIVLYDDRPEQVTKIAERLKENLIYQQQQQQQQASYDYHFSYGSGNNNNNNNSQQVMEIPSIDIRHIQVPDRYVPTAEMENELLWTIFRGVKERLGPVREVFPAPALSSSSSSSPHNDDNNFSKLMAKPIRVGEEKLDETREIRENEDGANETPESPIVTIDPLIILLKTLETHPHLLERLLKNQ